MIVDLTLSTACVLRVTGSDLISAAFVSRPLETVDSIVHEKNNTIDELSRLIIFRKVFLFVRRREQTTISTFLACCIIDPRRSRRIRKI